MMAKRSQTRRLFDILIDGMWHINGELAQKISSSKFGFCMRLTGRIHDLRQLGFDIRCEAIARRRGVFKYRMFTPRVLIDVENMSMIVKLKPSPEITQQQINFYEEIIRKEGLKDVKD